MKIATSDDGYDVDDGKVIVCMPMMGLEGKLIHSNQAVSYIRSYATVITQFHPSLLPFFGPPPIQIKIK